METFQNPVKAIVDVVLQYLALCDRNPGYKTDHEPLFKALENRDHDKAYRLMAIGTWECLDHELNLRVTAEDVLRRLAK